MSTGNILIFFLKKKLWGKEIKHFAAMEKNNMKEFTPLNVLKVFI